LDPKHNKDPEAYYGPTYDKIGHYFVEEEAKKYSTPEQIWSITYFDGIGGGYL